MTKQPRRKKQEPAVILMVSGGSDSVALLMKSLEEPFDLFDGKGACIIDKKRLHVLHINHMLRPVDSDNDEAFVRNLCDQYKLPFHLTRINVPQVMEERGLNNIESAARELRYEAAYSLARALAERGAYKSEDVRILTAHTADDRVETFFMRAIEGAGLEGLASIRPLRNQIVRPLLYCSRQELRDYLNEKQIGWCEDVTNEDTTYFRAFVRHEIIPRAKEKNPRLIETLSHSLDVIKDENEFIKQTPEDAYMFSLKESDDHIVVFDSAKIARLDKAIAKRVIRKALIEVGSLDARFDSKHIASALEGSFTRPFSVSLPGNVEVRREFDDLVIRNTTYNLKSVISGSIHIPGTKEVGQLGTMIARIIEVPPRANAAFLAASLSIPYENNPRFHPIVFDADKAGITEEALQEGTAELWVDSPKDGDSIEPQGMVSGSKKVFDVLAESKIPLRNRTSIPIVRIKDGQKLVCIAGIRVDRGVECSENSSRLVELSFK